MRKIKKLILSDNDADILLAYELGIRRFKKRWILNIFLGCYRFQMLYRIDGMSFLCLETWDPCPDIMCDWVTIKEIRYV